MADSILTAEQRVLKDPGKALKEAVEALQQKDFSKAADIYREILLFDPYQPGFWSNLSIALRNLGHRDTAVACARRAVALNPDDLLYLVNLSDCLAALDLMDEALDALEKALKIEPENLIYRRKYAAALQQSGGHGEALAQTSIIRTKEPDDAETTWQQGRINLALGNFLAGWKDYEMRWKRGFLKEKDYGAAPQWSGQYLADKTILLHEEQGFGDTIFAARYIPLVKQRGARVLFQCRSVMHTLFKDLPGIDRLPLEGPLGERFDYHAPLLSLPGVFNTTLETIPPPAHLSCADTLPPEVAQMLAAGKDRFKVGIVWSGNPEFKDNYKRAVPFSRFLPLMEIPGIQFYSLQKGAAEKELEVAGAQGLVLELTPHLKAFAETAAAVKKLDLIIMTDSAVAHLAGSLGKPVWNLLHFSPFWAYLLDRSDSPWYPSMRLFRQQHPGDWDGVFKEVAAELEKAVLKHKSG